MASQSGDRLDVEDYVLDEIFSEWGDSPPTADSDNDTAKSHNSESKSLEKPGKGTQSETTSSIQESEIMAGSKKSETKASSKEPETMASSKASETMASSKASETMASSKESETMATSKESETMASSKASETMASSKASETMVSSKASETMASSKESETMVSSKASETMASSKESETMASSKEPETLASSKEPETMTSSKEPETLASSKISTSTVVSLNDFQQLSLLERFRPGYLWVTDLTKQNWCEQQLFYTFTIPTVAVVEDTPVMKAGTDYHLARELATHDVVKVDVQSSEDIWAVKMLNLHSAVSTFLHGGNVAREVPVFGTPFNENILVVGLIDELRFDPLNYTIDLNELKTRQYSNLPSHAQKKQHSFQVSLYKTLFDDLVKGRVSKQFMASSLRIDLHKELGGSIREHAEKQFVEIKTLNDLMDIIFHKIQTLTCISQVFIEYVHQESKQTIGHVEVEYDVSEVSNLYKNYVQFWRGGRSAEGVDIEEAWKCQRCDFNSVCEWREKKAKEYELKNKQKNKRCK